jgi:hypothetical protein
LNHWAGLQRLFDLASSLVELHICGIEVIDVHPVQVIQFEPWESWESCQCLSIDTDE